MSDKQIIPAMSRIDMITSKKLNAKIAREVNKINKKREVLDRLREKENRLRIEIANHKVELEALTKKGSWNNFLSKT